MEGVRDVPVAVQREGVVSDPADNEEVVVSGVSGFFLCVDCPADEVHGNQ